MSLATSNSRRRKSLTSVQSLRQDIIAPLFKKGYSFREMRAEVMARLDLKTYSISTLKKDIDNLLAEWRAERIENVDQNIQLELERIDTLVREAWDAWEKSKTDYVKKKSRQNAIPNEGDGEGGGSDGVTVISLSQSGEEMTQCGDPRYIDTINKLLVERRKLLGLYAPEKNINVNSTKITAGGEPMSMKEIENEIKRLTKLDNGK